jgi:tetratricopeptide (TPR) repeat protein
MGDAFCAACGTKIEWVDNDKESVQESIPQKQSASLPAEKDLLCSICGYKNESTSQYCESCGARIAGTQPKPKTDTGVIDKPLRKTKKSDKKRKQTTAAASGTIILFAAAALLIVFAFYFLVIDRGSRHTNDDSRTAGMQGSGMNTAILREIEDLEHELDHHDSENDQVTIRLANLYHDIQVYDRAILYYNKFIERNPNNPDVRVDLGICFFESGQPEQAIQTVQNVIRDFPEHQLAVFNLGIIYLNLGDVETANSYFTRAYDINPDSATGERARRIIDEHTF